MWPFEISNSILRNIEFSFHLFHFHRFCHLFRYCSILLLSFLFLSIHPLFIFPSYADWFHVPKVSDVRNGVVSQADVLWYYAEDPDFTQKSYEDAVVSVSDATSVFLRPDPTLCPLHYGWFQDPVDHYHYYLGQDGVMVHGTQTIDGQCYTFSDNVDPGNYRLDENFRWRYRENGALPYGAWREEPPDLATNRYRIVRPDTANLQNRSDRDDRDAPSTDTHQNPTGNSDAPSEDAHHHAEGGPCIATDDWETILSDPNAYENCIAMHCMRTVYLTSKDPDATDGPVTEAPLYRIPYGKVCYPIDVSLESLCTDPEDPARISGMTFVMARENPDLRAMPMHLDRIARMDDASGNHSLMENSPEDDEAGTDAPEEDISAENLNEEGYAISFIDAFLNGPPEQGELVYAPGYPVETFGYEVRSTPDRDSTENLLPCEDPELCTMTVSRGTRIEQSEDFDEKTTVITRPLWIPDERQITGQYLHSLDLSSEEISMDECDPVTRFAHPAWDGGTYWLRSTPIAAASDASSGTEAASFLTASRSGRISSAVATDLHALRIGMCLSCPT